MISLCAPLGLCVRWRRQFESLFPIACLRPLCSSHHERSAIYCILHSADSQSCPVAVAMHRFVEARKLLIPATLIPSSKPGRTVVCAVCLRTRRLKPDLGALRPGSARAGSRQTCNLCAVSMIASSALTCTRLLRRMFLALMLRITMTRPTLE